LLLAGYQTDLYSRIDEEFYKSVYKFLSARRRIRIKRVERELKILLYVSPDISLIIVIIDFIRLNYNLAVISFSAKISLTSYFRGRDSNENIFSKESLKMED